MLILFIHRIIILALDPLILLALAEQLFWEGDSFLYLQIAAILLAVHLVFVFFAKQRFSLSLPFILAASLLLFFEVGVAIDVSQYQRLEGIRKGVAIGSAELLAIFGLIALFINSFRDEVKIRLVDKVGIITCFLSLVSALILVVSRGLRYGFAIEYDLSDKSLLLGALLLLIVRILLAGEFTLLPTKISKFISNCFAVISLLLILGIASLTLYCNQISHEPLPIHKDSDYKVSKVFLVRLLLVEDPLYLYHFGIDFKRVRDVVRETIEKGQFERGGSTISMQLAKIHYLYMDKTILRKFQQLIIGLLLEAKYSKEEILEAYLERVTFASDVRGLSDAARKFYGKDPTTLEPEQALTLVMSIYDPSSYNPLTPADSPRIEVRTALINSRIRRYSKTLVDDLKLLNIAQ